MMRKIYIWGLLLLTACGSPPRATTVQNTVLIRIAVTPALRPMAEKLHTCGMLFPDTGVAIDETSSRLIDYNSIDLAIKVGDNPGADFAYKLGDIRIKIIVNQDNPKSSITTDQLRKIYVGKIKTWSEIGGLPEPIQVWNYTEEDDIRLILDRVMLDYERLSPQALIASDPQAMLEAIEQDPSAIGFVPQIWMKQTTDNNRVHFLEVDPQLAALLKQPILALSETEPVGLLRQYLGCMQSASK